MAKVGLWLRGAKGKFAGAVLYKGKKSTVQRELVKPANPKTAKQTAQRLVFATVAQAAKVLEPLINHSFENVAFGDLSKQKFIQLNIKHLRSLAAIDYEETPDAIDANVFMTTSNLSTLIPNRYIVSKGTLNYTGALIPYRDSSPNSQIQLIGRDIDSMKMHYDGSWSQVAAGDKVKATIGEYLKKVIGLCGINEQISVVMVGPNDENTLFTYNNDNAPGFVIKEGGYNVKRLVFKAGANLNTLIEVAGVTLENQYKKINLSALSAATIQTISACFDTEKTDFDLLNEILAKIQGMYNNPSGQNTPVTVISDSATGSDILVSFKAADHDKVDLSMTGGYGDFHITHAGIVRSKKMADGSWKRSTCVLTNCGIGPTDDINYGLLWAVAPDAWFQGEVIAEDNRFLDQGGESDMLPGDE